MDSRLEKACTFLLTKAYPSYNKDTCGNCATAVRMACDFGFGVNIKKFPSAKDCAPAYEEIGFTKIFSFPEQKKEDYKPQIGDVAIIQYLPHGHICVYTSKGWVSDFKQIDMYGGSVRKKNPPFSILRLKS